MMENYYTDKSQVTSSGIKQMLKSPAHYLHFLEAPPSPSTDAMKFGSLLHTMVLEPDKLSNYVEKIHGNTSEGKEQIAREKQGLITRVSADDLKKAKDMHDAMKRKASQWLEPEGKVELTITWNNPIVGACKGKIDRYIPPSPSTGGKHIIFDLKTCEKAHGEMPKKSGLDFLYYVQAYWYITGLSAQLNVLPSQIEFIFFFIEKSRPYASRVFCSKDTDKFVKYGERKVLRALEDIKYCREKGVYPDYGDDAIEMELPRWVNVNE